MPDRSNGFFGWVLNALSVRYDKNGSFKFSGISKPFKLDDDGINNMHCSCQTVFHF
jgi:hypothetical protein